MLTDAGILARRARYECCALDYLNRAIEAQIHGDQKCYEENRRKWLWMSWAADVMRDTPVDGIEDGCTSLLFASDVADKADCLCDVCGCPQPSPQDCGLVPVFTVLEAIAFADLPLTPATDDAYFILSGDNSGSVATWDGAEWQYEAVTPFQLVWATVTNDYWTVGNGGVAGPWFPPPLLLNVTGDFWMAYSNPGYMIQGRTIQLQAFGPNGWYDVAVPTTESLLGQFLNLTGLPLNQIRFKYIDGDCIYYSAPGTFDPPIEPPAPCNIVPDYSVTQLVDANQEGSLLPAGPWFIATNTYGVTNGWSSHVGDIVNTDLSFTTVALGETVYDLQFSEYWTVTSGGIGPLFPNLTLTYGVGQYTISSQLPAISAVGTRLVIVADDDGTIVWGGTEDQLPSTLPFTGQFTEPITAIYFYDGACQYDTPVGVVQPEPVPVSILCDEDNLFQYRYTYTEPQQILISAPPGQTLFISFAQGEMDPDTVIFIYDGNADTDPVLASGSYANLGMPPLQVTSTGQYILIDIFPTIEMPDDLLTWQFQVSCVPTGFAAIPIITDDCLTYQFNVSVQVDFGNGMDYNFEVYLNASPTPIVFGPYSGEATYDLGDYPIGATVSVIMRNDADSEDYLWLGNLVTNGACPNDPCAPIPDFIVRLESCSGVPVDGSPYVGILWLLEAGGCPFLTFDEGDIITWDVGTRAYVLSNIPVGSVILGDDGTYYVEVQAGVVIPYFQLTIAAPTGNTPLNWQFSMPAIQQYGITTNRPVAIQVSDNGITWTTVWTGNEQDLATPQAATINFPINQLRSLWFPDACAFVGPVTILT